MGGTLRLVLGDQLSTTLSALRGGDTANDTVLMAEVAEEASYVPHHKKKLAFVFAAMRHHAAVLSGHGWRVIYHALDDDEPASSLTDALNRAIRSVQPQRIVVTEPGEWRVLEKMRDWRETLDIPLDIRADDRFIASHADFAAWAKDGRKTLRMEYFYREMRKRTGYLMEGEEPVGGAWNHDASNRKPLPADLSIPQRPQFPANATTRVVIAMVAERFAGNFGSLGGFDHPVTRDDAVTYLDWFIENALPLFGDY
nr:cryptochrome/photolyase family protein [Rhizobiaceae bacterium]